MPSDPAVRESPFGTWPSPISAVDVARSHGSIAWVEQVDGALWWVESDPLNGGTLAIMREGTGGAVRMTAPDANVRNRVHEYGGLPWVFVPANSSPDSAPSFCFTEWTDQRVYRQPAHGAAVALTPAPAFDGGYRYAEPLVNGVEIWALREHHLSDSPTDVRRDFVAIPLEQTGATDPSAIRELGAVGHHFLAGLRVSPDGTRAAWIGWNHPFMPWDRTELVVADIEGGVFVRSRIVAGGARTNREPVAGIAATHTPGTSIAICQVEWDADGSLVYLSDESGWWNLHRWNAVSGETAALHEARAELGGALWRPGLRWFAPLGGGRYGVLDHGAPHIFDESTKSLEPMIVSTAAGLPRWRPHLSAADGRLASVGYGPASLPRLVSHGPGGFEIHGQHPSLPVIGDAPIDPAWLPRPEVTSFTGPDGAAVPATVYAPCNPQVRAPAGERAPYVVHVHGGPTGDNDLDLDLEIAYLTSRGIGVVAPEYGGSTGFGRAWRERLNGGWGVVDLADAQTVADGLVADGRADPTRLGIRGGSAGGFTSALAMTRPSSFAVGFVRYPVIDLIGWASGETHDLESQYLVGLVGTLPQDRVRFDARSPSTATAAAHGPMLILQGLDDRICLPVSTERFVAGLTAARKPHRYIAYVGEQHGFRRAETIAHAIASEFAYLCESLGIDPVVAEDPLSATGGSAS